MEAASSAADSSRCQPATRPTEQPLDRLEAELCTLWGHVTAATFRFLELVAEFDRRQGWVRHGLASCAQWLSWQCGIDSVTAREKVRIARALEKLPLISDSFRRGVISYSKVRAMTRIACPENEAALLNVAEHGTAPHVEKLVRKYRWVERLEDAQRANGQHYHRYLSFHHDDDGSILVNGRLPPEIGAVVRKAIEAAVDLARNETRSDAGTPKHASAEASEVEPHSVNDARGAERADALLRLSECFLAHQADDLGSVADRHQVVVHIDQRLLATGSVYSTESADDASSLPGRCEIEGERALALETARRLACDCSAVGIVEDDNGNPLDVGRKTRSIPPAIQRALDSRDGGCRFPGCDRTRYTQGHHIRHWVNGGETKLGNLVTLCSFHHRLVHEGGFGLRATDDGVFVFTRPDGSRIEENGVSRWRFRGSVSPERREGAAHALFEANISRGLEIDARTARCGWQGELMDYGLAVEYLIRVRDTLALRGAALS